MAYAAVTCLAKTLDQILNPKHRYFVPFKKQQIDSLHEKFSFLQVFLETTFSEDRKEAVSTDDPLEAEIRDAAYKVEDIIESHIRNHFLPEAEDLRYKSFKVCCRDLEKVIQEIDLIKNEAILKVEDSKIKNGLQKQKRNPPPVSTSKNLPGGKNTTVGLVEDLKKMKGRLIFSNQSELEIIPIVGMAGIGKTTFARKVYDDPEIKNHFDVCAWTTLSQSHQLREILLGILNSTIVLTPEIRQASNGELLEYVYRSLKGRRYLIVLDDLWRPDAWDDIRRCFPDDDTGSRILLTTREVPVADYIGPSALHHRMNFLSDAESLTLLHERVFGVECCPPELKNLEKKIAENCHGLPLVVAVVGGLLSKASRERDFWENVERNVSSFTITNDEEVRRILLLSYNHLPQHLKPCFLYMGFFPEDYEVHVSRLIRLWTAEEFLKAVGSKSSEEVADEYLKDLIERNLILVHQKGFNGKVKTCGIHDVLRDLCVSIGQTEKFLYVLNRNLENISNQRRLALHPSTWKHEDGDDPLDLDGIPENIQSNARSFVFFAHPDDHRKTSADGCGFKLLRVFDSVNLTFVGFPEEILQLANLRYLAFACHSSIPFSISSLKNLQTLINYGTTDLPSAIWDMPKLTYVHFNKGLLPHPGNNAKGLVPTTLETLSQVINFAFTGDIVKRLRNLRKLKLYYGNASSCSLHNLALLHKVETLKISCRSKMEDSILHAFALPLNVKKLTLAGCRIPWKYMTVISSLPKLESLKLKDRAFKGRKWEPVEGGFRELRLLLLSRLDLVEWEGNDDHFPSLQHLILDHCHVLEQIPSVGTFELIKLINSNHDAVEAAKQIQEELDVGNGSIHVEVVDTAYIST